MLSLDDQRRGRLLGAALQQRRGLTSGATVANAAGISVDTLRKLEQGDIPTPGFFLVARIAAALQISLDELASAAAADDHQGELGQQGKR